MLGPAYLENLHPSADCEDGETVDRIPFSFGTVGLEMVAAFSKNLRAAIDKI
jgi:hypothetical protein